MGSRTPSAGALRARKGDMDLTKPITGFSDVDRATDPQSHLNYLDRVSALETARAYKKRSFHLLRATEGARVLEVGCGTGEDTRVIASSIGPSGLVVGVDNSATMIEECRRRADGSGTPVEYHVGDAHHLQFPENTFDACRADRTFQHLDDPARALDELVRVVRPGGWVVVSEPDWGTLVIDGQDRPLTQRMTGLWCETARNGWMGRRLPVLFKRAGLTDVTVLHEALTLDFFPVASEVLGIRKVTAAAVAAGAAPAEDVERWLRSLEAAHEAGEFFSAIMGFTAAGRKL